MYDMDGDGEIKEEELLSILHMMVGANISEEQVWMWSWHARVQIQLLKLIYFTQLESIAERTMAEADEDKDGTINFEEFVRVCQKTLLFM